MILVFTLYDFDTLKYGKYDYPEWADGVGWLLSLASVFAIPVVAIVNIVKEEGSIMTVSLNLFF